MASEKKIKDQQRFNESVKEELKLREKERGVLNSLISLAKVKGKISNDAKQTQQDLVASLTETAQLESESEKVNAQIEAVQKAKLELIKEAEEKGEAINAHLINQLDATEEILMANRERAAINDELMNTTKNILGLDSELERAIAKGGVAALAMNKAFENVGKSLSSHVDALKDMVTQQGLSVGEAFALKGNIDAASMSVTGFLYGSDQIAASAQAITEEYGSINAATTDLIKGVTEVASLTGDATTALKLTEAFESAGVEAGDVKDTISDIAKEAGVSGKMAVKGLGDQMFRLVGASEEELKTIIEGNIELQKRGMTMSDIEALSNSMLDIETSMKKEAKLRAMTGKDIGANEMRNLALARQQATSADERKRIETQMADLLMDKVGSAEEFNDLNLTEQRLTAEAYGMSVQELTTKIQTAEKQKELTAKYGEYAGFVEGAQGFLTSSAKMAGSMAMEMGKVVLKTAIMNKMMGGSSGIGNILGSAAESAKGLGKNLLNIGKGGMKDMGQKIKGGVKGLFTKSAPTENIPKPEKMTETLGDGGKAAGGGGMKEKFQDMAEGLKAMGDGKVFAGIGAVALAGPAFIIALPSIPFLLFMGLTPLKQLETNFSGLATGLNSMASTFMGSLAVAAFGIAAIPSIASIPFLLFMGLTPLAQLAPNFTSLSVGLTTMASTFMGSLALGAFAVAAGLAIASIPFLIAISLLGIAASAGLSALGIGLTALGTAAASGLPFLGIALIGALGLAMIPFAIALNIATPAIEAFGGVIVGVMGAIPPIISAIAEGFVTMMGALSLENIGAWMLLGPALLLASVGMIAFSAAMLVGGLGSFFGGGIIDDISELAMIGPQLGMAGEGLAAITTNLSEVSGVIETLSESLSTMGSVTAPLYGVAGGLFSIAGGLISMAGAGLLALPLFAALGGLAAIAPVLGGLGSLFGGGDEEESKSSDSGDSDMIDYDRLASVLQSQPIVLTIDGKAVQKITAVQRRQGKNARSFS